MVQGPDVESAQGVVGGAASGGLAKRQRGSSGGLQRHDGWGRPSQPHNMAWWGIAGMVHYLLCACHRPMPYTVHYKLLSYFISPPNHPPCVTFRLVVVPLWGPGQSTVLPFACCVGLLLSVGRCGRCSCWCRVSSWCVGAVLNVAWCAVCASAAPNSWCVEDVLVVARVV